MDTKTAAFLYKYTTGETITQQVLRRYIREGRIKAKRVLGRYDVNDSSLRKFVKARKKALGQKVPA